MGDDNKFKDSPREQKNNFSDSPREVKKKEPAIATPSASASTVNPLSSPSVSEGGTSGLEITPSASQNIPNLPGRVNPNTLATYEMPSKQEDEIAMQKRIEKEMGGLSIPSDEIILPKLGKQPQSITSYTPLGERIKTELGGGTKISKTGIPVIESITFDQSKEIQDQDIIAKNIQEKETKAISDFHDKVYLPQALAKGIQPNSRQADIDFYLEYLKQNNPEEFKYLSQKHASLQGTVADDIKSGEDKEDTQEDKLALERFQAELLTKATALKTRANQGSYKMAENNIKNYYQDKLKSYTDLSKSMETDLNQFNAINDELGTYPKNEQGQIITDATNRKKVEELIKKQQEILSGLEGKNGQLDEIKGDKDFNDAMKTLDETQSNYESVSKRYYDLASNNPDAFKALPEYKALLERKKKAKEEKDYKENVLGVTSFGVEEGAGRAMTGIISSLAYLPKSLTSNSEYGWTDKLSDIASNNIDDFNDEYIATPTEMDKPLLEDGKWNLKYLPGKVAQTATDMAIMIAITKGVGTGAGALTRGALSGEAAASLGSIVSGYTMSANGYYQEAKEAGMSDKEATSFSRTLAIQQALLELVSPNEKLLSPSLIKNDVKEFSKILAKGASGTQAAKQLATSLIKKNVPEISQELLQTLDEHVNKFSSAELSKANENVRQSLGEQMVETAILTALTTTMLGGATGDFTGQKGKMQKQALYMAAYAPDKTIQALNKMYANDQITQEQLNEMSQKIQVASESLSKMGNIPQEKKINALWAQYDKDLLQNEASKTDPIYQEPINQKIAEKEQEIQQILNEPSEEELTNDRIVELQDLESVGLINESEKSELKELLTIKQSKNVQEEKSQAEVLNEPSLQEEGKMFEVDTTEQRQPIELDVAKKEIVPPPTENVGAQLKEEAKPSSDEVSTKKEVELEPIFAGGMPRKMEFKDGEWKLLAGDEYTKVAPAVQQQAQEAFDKLQTKTEENVNQENEQGLPSEKPIGEESIKTEPKQTTSGKETSTSGVLQAQEEVEATAKALEGVDTTNLEDKVDGIVYHGTSYDIQKPSIEKYGQVHDMGGMLGRAVYYTPSKSEAEYFAELSLNKNKGGVKKIISGLLKAKNPIFVSELIDKVPADILDKWIRVKNTYIGSAKDLKQRVKIENNEKSLTSFLSTFGDISELAKMNGNDAVMWGYEKGKPNEIAIVDDNLVETNKQKIISEAYHKAKADGSNPELVKAVEDLIGNKKEEVKPVKEKPKSEPISKKQELIDEEEVADSKKQESKEVLDSLEKDIAALKQTKDKTLAEKKVQGALYRAYKAKEEGKIKKSTYTAFRNTIEEVAGPKVNTDKAKAKMHLSLIKDKVKERLLGEGFKNVAMSAPGVNPKVVEDIIDATFGLMDRAIDAGFAIKQSVETAARLIKNTAAYKAAIRNGIIKEGELDTEIQKALVEKEKELEDNAKNEKEAKVEGNKGEQKLDTGKEDILGGEKKNKTIYDRQKQSGRMQKVFDKVSALDKSYDVVNKEKTKEYIDKVIKIYESNDAIMDLYKELKDKTFKVNDKIRLVLEVSVANRLSELAMDENLSEVEKEALEKASADLLIRATNESNVAATQTSMNSITADIIGGNPVVLEKNLSNKIKQTREGNMSEEKKQEMNSQAEVVYNESNVDPEFYAKVKEDAKKEVIDEMSKKIFGSEEKAKKVSDAIDSIFVDLSEC